MLVLSGFCPSLKSQQTTDSIFMNTDRPTRSYNPKTLAKNLLVLYEIIWKSVFKQ